LLLMTPASDVRSFLLIHPFKEQKSKRTCSDPRMTHVNLFFAAHFSKRHLSKLVSVSRVVGPITIYYFTALIPEKMNQVFRCLKLNRNGSPDSGRRWNY